MMMTFGWKKIPKEKENKQTNKKKAHRWEHFFSVNISPPHFPL